MRSEEKKSLEEAGRAVARLQSCYLRLRFREKEEKKVVRGRYCYRRYVGVYVCISEKRGREILQGNCWFAFALATCSHVTL